MACIALIGFSGCGKSFWSQRLADEAGYLRIDVDLLVEKKLGLELTALGYQGIADVARWLGMPYERRYRENQARYLAWETSVMWEVLEYLEMYRTSRPRHTVVDTTGSFVYTGDEVTATLNEHSTVVYLETSEVDDEEMYRRFVEHPKPLIWGHTFTKRDDENETEALARCYLDLIAFRRQRYARCADVVVPFERHSDAGLTVGDFLEMVGAR